MAAFSFLFAWYNLPFSVAIGCARLLAVLQLLSGFSESDADSDVELQADVEIDAQADAELAPEAGAEPETSVHSNGLLAVLGAGQVPLMIVLIGLLGSLGAIGLFNNSVLALLPLWLIATWPAPTAHV